MDNGDKRGVGREQREGRRIHFFMDSNSGICNIKNHSQGVVSFNGVPGGKRVRIYKLNIDIQQF